MPATEETWRPLSLMHVLFGVSSVGMLFATVWMFADDHTREWKRYQRQFRDMETRMAEYRVREGDDNEYRQRLDELNGRVTEARSAVPDAELLARFKELVAAGPSDGQSLYSSEELEELFEKIDARQAEISELAVQARDRQGEAKKAAAAAEKAAAAVAAANEAVAKARAAENASEAEIASAMEQVEQTHAAANAAQAAAKQAQEQYSEAAETVGRHRDELFTIMRDVIAQAKFHEDNLTRTTKEKRAGFDKARADYELGIGNNLPDDELKELQARVTQKSSDVEAVNRQLQEAKSHRQELERVLGKILEQESVARKELDEHRTKLVLLEKTVEERERGLGKRLLELPVIDAFNSPLKIEQIWLPDLTLYNNFRNVARFDRCITCHLAMDKTMPGTATEPLYEHAHELPPVTLETPAEPPKSQKDEQGEEIGLTTRAVYGLELAEKGLVDEDEVTISAVWPETRAAVAGLQIGDVIQEIRGARMYSREQAVDNLLERVNWGAPLALKVRRGIPHPFSSHPRLDLFVSSVSPHPMGQVGCTICHEGQGSATEFKWTSHMPNTPKQAEEWARDHNWFNNHHWIFPMYPKRFAESSCLKCHHNVAELEVSDRFPDPPAPKLMQGYHLIRQYGCFGCHEINGYDGPDRRVGPDLRLEPNYFAAAQELKTDRFINRDPRMSGLVDRLIRNPEDNALRARVRQALLEDAAKAELPDGHPLYSPESHQVAELLSDVEVAGEMRKVGPSLRYVASKLDFGFVYDWVRNPQHFRPDTHMPRFFGLWDHLDGDGLAVAQRYEPLEIRTATEYLLRSSQPFEYLKMDDGQPFEYDAQAGADLPEEIKASAERGKGVFQLRGCLACHQHADFPAGKATQGPDLSRIGAKLKRHPYGDQWLYSWVREPHRYHPRSLMPNVFLEPIRSEDGGVTDPAADVANYLMGSQQGWQPLPPRETENADVSDKELWRMTEEEGQTLVQLAREHLGEKFSEKRVEEFIAQGITGEQAKNIKGDEAALIGPTTDKNRGDKLIDYVGRRTIGKYGCYGCHDIPGFEAAKPIGTALADWGRKDPSRLAFEQIGQYLSHHHGHGSAHETGAHEEHSDHAAEHAAQVTGPVIPQHTISEQARREKLQIDTEFFLEKVASHEREGFLWQKLRAPRSYDYKKTENKRYNERLRMPAFPFDQEQIEAVSTFVLGLVAEPPAQKYLYEADPRRQVIVEGNQVLTKYNCGGCHTLQMDTWQVEYREDDFEDAAEVKTELDPDFQQAPNKTYSITVPHFTPEEIARSLATDRRGFRHVSLVGMPVLNPQTGKPDRVDPESGEPIEADDTETPGYYQFTLFKDALINGQPRLVGIETPLVPEQRITKVIPGRGGDLARLLFPVAVAEEKKANPNVNVQEAWGWLPPPLIGEGSKVQSNWLHNFLLDPYRIRPSVVLRMPKFNMSPDEASKLVNYFAAVDGVDYPYEFDDRTRADYLAAAERAHPGHLQDAMKLVTNGNYCVKCHQVGEYMPPGRPTALAPDLAKVNERLRPDFVHPWIANPKRFLPYTSMPVNIPPDQPAAQDVYKGSSSEQVAALVDLLMNFDVFTQRQYKVEVQALPPDPAATGTAPSADGDGAGQGGAEEPEQE